MIGSNACQRWSDLAGLECPVWRHSTGCSFEAKAFRSWGSLIGEFSILGLLWIIHGLFVSFRLLAIQHLSVTASTDRRAFHCLTSVRQWKLTALEKDLSYIWVSTVTKRICLVCWPSLSLRHRRLVEKWGIDIGRKHKCHNFAEGFLPSPFSKLILGSCSRSCRTWRSFPFFSELCRRAAVLEVPHSHALQIQTYQIN